jgi:hypothetical protein
MMHEHCIARAPPGQPKCMILEFDSSPNQGVIMHFRSLIASMRFDAAHQANQPITWATLWHLTGPLELWKLWRKCDTA